MDVNQSGILAEPGTSDTAVLSDSDFKRHSVHGGALTMVAQTGKFLLQLGSTAILARLLTPEDYGLFVMALVVTSFGSLFSDLGLSMATVQSLEVDENQMTALFWINAATGVCLTLLFGATAPVLAWFYQEPRLVGITAALALIYAIGGLGNQHQARLRRQMRFLSLAVIDVASMVCGVAVAILAALDGAGYWALVFLQLAIAGANVVGAWLVSRWMPGPPRGGTRIRPFLVFGGNLTGVNVLNFLIRNVDNLLIGWRWGAAPLGLYEKAYQLLLLPVVRITSPLSGVAVPVLSRLQGEPRRYRNYFTKIILMVVSLGMPLVTFLFVTADQAIPLILGSQWISSIPLFRALAPAAFIETINSAVNWMFLSLGQTARQFRVTLLTASIILVSFVIGLGWGPLGVAIAFSLCRFFTVIPTLVIASHDSSVRWTDVLFVVLRPAAASIGAGLFLALVGAGLQPFGNALIDLIIAGAVYGLLYSVLWVALPAGRGSAREIIGLVAALIHPDAVSTSPVQVSSDALQQ